MDYTSVPIHEFLRERVKSLARARNPYTKANVIGPLGDRTAWYEVKVEFGDNKVITHLMVQLYHRDEKSALFSIHAQMDSGKPRVFRVVFQSVDKYNIVLTEIENATLQAFIDGQR